MKIKLDENIGSRGVVFLRAAGHGVMTVREQNLHGATDKNLFAVCTAETRVLITLDHDFGQVLRFPPEHGAGLIILEPGGRLSIESLLDRLREFLKLAETQSPVGALWIVEPGRIRVHLPKA